MSTNRSAINTIKGYFYQFDYSILRILELNKDDESITIEHIEDIDIHSATETTAIQCKYYEKTEYNHSVIAKPIRFMLSNFIELKRNGKQQINYLLYGYYQSGQEKLNLPLSVDDLKNKFLTYTKEKNKHYFHTENNISNEELYDFLSHLTININAEEYDQQLQSIFTTMKNIFHCTDFEAEHLFYNNALRFIKNISVKESEPDRTITKRKFIEGINTKSILFNQWFIEYKGLKRYFKSLRKEYFTELNISPFERFFLIEIDKNRYFRNELKDLIFFISKKWTKITQRTTDPFCPYLYIHNIDEQELVELKKELISENFRIIDGYDFEGAEFNVKSIIKKANYNNQIKLKIINKKEFIDSILIETSKTKEVYQFYFAAQFYENKSTSIKHIKIQIKELKNIKEII